MGCALYETLGLDCWSGPRCADCPSDDDGPLGTCVIHGDYWTDDCVRCQADQGVGSPALPRERANEEDD